MYETRLDKAARLRPLLPASPPGRLHELPLELYLFDDAQLSVLYAPVDFVNAKARLVLAALTPSWRQTRAAYAAHAELSRLSEEQRGLEIQRRSAFTGTMRQNLIAMLDELGIHRYLGLPSAAALFGERSALLHATSVLRYPVFRTGKNYSGQHPRPAAHPFLREMLERLCATELASVPEALIVPLGKAAEEGLEHLSALGLLRGDRWLRGFPHPSAASAHKSGGLGRARADLRSQVEAWFARGSTTATTCAGERPGARASGRRLAAAM